MARRRGMTLIELLIVVTVLAILLGTVLTMMQPVMRDMRAREAARVVNAFLAGAQARAAELNRPVAVYIEPYDGYASRGVAFQLFLAESPPPYAGDTTGALATISGEEASSATLSHASLITALDIDQGDLIRFDYKGHYYEIIAEPSGGNISFKVSPAEGIESPPPGKVPYQIFRKPIKTVASPLDIPEPLCIDIRNSGMGLLAQFEIGSEPYDDGVPRKRSPVIISFAPSGGIHRVYGAITGSDRPAHKPTEAVHLLVGWADQAARPEDQPPLTGEKNLNDGSARWVSVGHVTGRITSTENKPNDSGTTSIDHARQWAAEAQGMGSGV